MRNLSSSYISYAFLLVLSVLLSGCSSTPPATPALTVGKAVCDTYIIMSMCVHDLDTDGTVDMVYFTDTLEAFMYQEGRQSVVKQVMPFHRCAVPLGTKMQATTNRILNRENLTFTEELDITRDLLASYSAAKPTIDECNARYEDASPVEEGSEEDFSDFESDWDIE